MFNPEDYEPINFDNAGNYVHGKLPAIDINDYFQDGRYEILNKLGEGGYSNVWLARDHQ